jgi:O-antigen/teichoic acid export membrane protein
MTTDASLAAIDLETSAEATAATDRRGLGFNLSVLAGGQAITWSVTLAWTLVVPRLLGPVGMGQLTAAYAAAAIFIVVLGFGTKIYLVREFVAHPEQAPDLMGTALWLRLCSAPVVAAAVVVYGQLAHFDEPMLVVLYIATGAAFFTMFNEPLLAGWQGMERMEYLAYSDVLDKTAASVVGIAIVLMGLGVFGVVSATLVIEFLILLLNAWWMRRYIRVTRRPDIRRMGRLIRRSLPYWTAGVFFMIYLWVDTAMLSIMEPPAVVGWYGVSTRLFTTLMFIPAILCTAWLPRLVKAYGGGTAQLHAEARAPVELTLGLALPICVVTFVTAGPVIRLLYGPGYVHAVPVLMILALCLPLMYLNTMLNQVLVAANRQRVWTWVMLGATIVNPAFNYVLIRATQSRYHNGAIGAAISLLLTELLIVAVGIVVVGHRIFSVGSLGRLARITLAAVIMAGAMYAVRPLGFVAATLAGGLAFIGAVIALRVPSAAEKAWVRGGVDRAWRSIARLAPGRRPES